jgi:hypothetical protein
MIIGPPPKFHGTRDILDFRIDLDLSTLLSSLLVAVRWACCCSTTSQVTMSRYRVITESADNRDLTSWLVGLVSEAFVLLKRGDVRQAAEMVGIANRQGQLIVFAPEAMDPVEHVSSWPRRCAASRNRR